MDGKHRQLLLHCASLLDSYDSETTGLEEHLDGYLYQHTVHDEDDVTFLREVFSGCVRYRAILKVVVDGFYVRAGRNVLRSNQNLFTVLTYLALFRLDELGVAHYRKFISAVELNQAYKFHQFFFDEKSLMTWMKDGWNKVFEPTFVQTSLLSPILRWLPELMDVVKLLKDKIDNKVKPKKSTLPLTETKPFELTKPRPRSIPIPEKIPTLQMSRPIPKTLYRSPTEQEELAKQREENRRVAEERLMQSSRYQLACANPEKSDKTRARIAAIVNEENGKMDVNKVKARPVPDFKKDAPPVKMTAAAILREGRLYQKQEDEVMNKLRQLEAGAYDASSFSEWQAEKKREDAEEELAMMEQRRLLGKLSHEEAILARRNKVYDNHEKVREHKMETAEMMKEYLDKKFQEEIEMKMLVENTMAGHRNAKDAKKKLKEYKQKIVQEVTEESRELMKQALEEAEAEMRCKMELIQQIRAMEATPVSRFKVVDLTTTSGEGFLSEMSIVELRERLALMKERELEEEEEKRDLILNAKQAKAEFLSETLDRISKHRAEQTRSAAVKLESKRKNQRSAPFRNEALTELERKVEEKRAQRLREQERAQILPSRDSAKRTKSLISQKVCNKFYPYLYS